VISGIPYFLVLASAVQGDADSCTDDFPIRDLKRYKTFSVGLTSTFSDRLAPKVRIVLANRMK